MRGKGLEIEIAGVPHGITPAYAGKRFFIFRSAAVVRDHPRLCGEKQNVLQSGLQSTGSPPPMRGKVAALKCN